MTPIKPEDRPKAIALVAAIALVFGFAAWNLRARNSTAQSSPATTAAAPPAAPAAGAFPWAQAAPIAAEEQPVLPPDLNNNPFRPIAAQATTAPITPARPAPAPPPAAASVTPVTPSPDFGSGGPARGAAFDPLLLADKRPPLAPTPPSSSVAPAAVAPAPETPLELKGVITGGALRAVAMIRAGEQQYFVRVGERVKGYKIAAIAAEEVTLRRGESTRVLRIGGGSAATAAAPNKGRVPATALSAPAVATPVAAAPRKPASLRPLPGATSAARLSAPPPVMPPVAAPVAAVADPALSNVVALPGDEPAPAEPPLPAGDDPAPPLPAEVPAGVVPPAPFDDPEAEE